MSAISSFEGVLGGIAGNNPLGGVVSGAADEVAGLGLHAIGAWVLDGTQAALKEVASVIGSATSPNLESTWFSATYWRVAALAAMLTLPFLCAAAVQAVARADPSLLGRAVFGYLPVSVLGVSLAAPLTMLLLAATDQMSAAVSASAATGGAHFLDQAAAAAGAMSSLDGSPFFAVVVGMLAVMAALALAVELLVRAAAVYVVVLMLPLAFAALVWPARRIWAVRMVELLVSLILSKFVMVAVLSLAAAAFANGDPGISQLLTAMALIMLSTFAPWALMRILPFTEVASGAAGILRQELPQTSRHALALSPLAGGASELAMSLPARMRRQADDAGAGFGGDAMAASGSAGRAWASEPAQAGSPGGEAPTTAGPQAPTTPGSETHPAPGPEGPPRSGPSESAAPASADTATGATPRYVPPFLSDEPLRLDADFVARFKRDGKPANPEEPAKPEGPEEHG